MPGKHSTMKMSHAKMKTPMDMKTPMKKMDPMYNGEPGVQKEDFKQFMKMKSPAKLGSAYKLDKSAFKMKNGPMKMYGDKAGSMAKMAGVMKMKTPMKTSLTIIRHFRSQVQAGSSQAMVYKIIPKMHKPAPRVSGTLAACTRP